MQEYIGAGKDCQEKGWTLFVHKGKFLVFFRKKEKKGRKSSLFEKIRANPVRHQSRSPSGSTLRY